LFDFCVAKKERLKAMAAAEVGETRTLAFINCCLPVPSKAHSLIPSFFLSSPYPCQADEETGEWETVPVKTKKPSMKSADSDDEDGEPKAKVAEATIYFECDVKMHGRIIGPGGATLNVLEEGTGCKVGTAVHRTVCFVRFVCLFGCQCLSYIHVMSHDHQHFIRHFRSPCPSAARCTRRL
jgi:hypothetical protein